MSEATKTWTRFGSPTCARAVLHLIEQNPNMSARDLMEIAGIDGDQRVELALWSSLRWLERKGRIARSPGRRFCYTARRPVWTWTATREVAR